MAKKNEWTPAEAPKLKSGIVVNMDVNGNPFFQARYEVIEWRMEGKVKVIRTRKILGQPVYLGKFMDPELYISRPDFTLAGEVVKSVWSTIRSVVSEKSECRGE